MNLKLSSLARSIGLAVALSVSPGVFAGEHADRGDRVEPGPQLSAPQLPLQSLSPETLYLLILAEIAGARGEIDIAVDAYLRVARATADPRIARRATEIALFARNTQAATEAARLWSEADPTSEDARRILAGVLASGGDRLNEVQIELARILAHNPEQLEQNLLGLNRALSRLPDRYMARSIIERLTAPYLDEPAAQLARAQAAAEADDGMGALEATEQALRLRPRWEPAILLKSQLLVQLDASDEAVSFLGAHVAAAPENLTLRQHYARTLVSARRLDAALREFEHLLGQHPGNPDLLFAVALISQELGDLDRATSALEQALLSGHPETNAIRLNLGNLAEQRGDSESALHWYREVPPGPHFIEAQIRTAITLAGTGQLDDALAHLDATVAEGDETKRILIAKTSLLRDAGRFGDALILLDSALRETPDDPELLYEAAMTAEQLDRVDLMESRLRRLIELDPEHAHAYNALGYSLADRGLRLQEAEAMIVRALELSPDDPFILDSMGWVRFRQHDPEGALQHLERAYALRSDPEIAAHLGEVLWALERREDALRIWSEAREAFPDHEILYRTIERLTEE